VQDRSKTITWSTISAVAGIGATWLALTELAINPLGKRIEVLERTLSQALTNRDHRLDRLEERVHDLERQERR
jgi:hypothetical protein